ncbi:MAG: GNAT family N-acetyltransferase [Actinobacteria bacterium]|uniref:Unannotated protein n=1 Tax=freshwater metagenome TaxID=449393 RepID=A0A6J6RMN1_9ZZZZ|nr:GNAT family N-acetyltransferase [Actinomycetota bacterium]
MTDLRMETFDPVRDVEELHAWVVADRARFWMMQDHTVDEVREIYTWLHEQPTHHVWWVVEGEQRVALLQDYLPEADEVGEHYPVRPGDLGVHLMLAEGGARRPGFTAEVAAFGLEWCFAQPEVQRLVVEPDARNDKALARATRMGFTLGDVVQLSTKPAQLGFLTRETYEAWRSLAKNASA